MEFHIFSDFKTIDSAFTKIKKIKDHSFAYHSLSDLKKVSGRAAFGSFFYVDISKLTEQEKNKTLKALYKLSDHLFGILDPKGALKDAADLFHNGASDYIGKETFTSGITKKRLATVIEFRSLIHHVEKEADDGALSSNYIISGTDWSGIRVGREYTFCFMFIELDRQSDLRKKFGDSHLQSRMKAFHDHIENVVSEINGRIWMWMDFGGLVLFPFDGEKCDAILASFRLMLARKIISLEIHDFNMILSYRIALHIGNTIYRRRGDTGAIVSDSINSIFHLGQKFAKPGSLNLTENVKQYIPEGLGECFTQAGIYEGREIYRMNVPI